MFATNVLSPNKTKIVLFITYCMSFAFKSQVKNDKAFIYYTDLFTKINKLVQSKFTLEISCFDAKR